MNVGMYGLICSLYTAIPRCTWARLSGGSSERKLLWWMRPSIALTRLQLAVSGVASRDGCDHTPICSGKMAALQPGAREEYIRKSPWSLMDCSCARDNI